MGERGFTLLEVLVALLILVFSFSVLLGLLEQSLKTSQRSEQTLNNFLCLDNSYKLRKFGNLSVQRVELEDYGITLKVYRCKEFRLLEVER